MKTHYKILLRIILLTLILFVFGFVYNKYFYENDIQKYSEVINLVRAIPDDADIVYIGESSNITFREDDLDKRSISSFISDYYPSMKVCDITKPASHSGIYKTLIANIPKSSKLQTLIVTLNLRSFNATWIYSDLETSLQKSMVLLKDYPKLVNRFLLSFKAYDIKTEKERENQMFEKWEKDDFGFPYSFPHKNVVEWDYWMASTATKDSAGKIDFKTELACHYIKTYGFQLDTMNNPRIADFDEIIELAKERNWNLVFNLLAENLEMAEDLVGKDLIYLMNRNRKTLVEYFENRNVMVVDNFSDVESEQFVEQHWTTEHYAEKGRKQIAAKVAKNLKAFYPNKYSEADILKSNRVSFFNDCDKKTIWGQMHTIVSDNSFSGKQSSKTGKENDFSITFEYPIKVIPDSVKNIINVNLKIYQYSENHDSKLVFEASGEGLKHYWMGVPLNKQIQKINSWENFNHTFIIPDKIKQADLIKIYVYNSSNQIVLVDDFKIEFK